MTSHGVLEIHEAIAFLLIAAGYVPVVAAFIQRKSTKYFFTAYTALFIGAFATNLEGYFPDTGSMATGLNYVEHIVGILVAALFFFLAAYRSHEKTRSISKSIQANRFSSGGGTG